MSGPTNRRFVRAAWALLAFQFVAATGALALAIWASTKVQNLIDQRDQLQARVTQLEARPMPITPDQDVAPVELNAAIPVEAPVADPVAPQPVAATKAPSQPSRPPPVRDDGFGVTVHRATPPPIVVETPGPRPDPPAVDRPPRNPPIRYPPRVPPEVYVPPRLPPVRFPPPRDPPIRVPPRQPPATYVPPRVPPQIVRPNVTTRPAPTPAPTPGIVTRPTPPIVTRPAPTVQPIDPRRIRRPRVTNAEPQPDPPK